MAGNGNGEQLVLFKYMQRVERRFDQVDRDLRALRNDFRVFAKQVAKIFATHRRQLNAQERRIAALERRAA